MSRSRRRLPSAACALVAALACSLVTTATASAVGGTITDAPASFARGVSGFDSSPSADFTGVSTPNADHLFEVGWAYRVAGDTAEAFLPLPTTESYVGSQSTIDWTNVAARNLFDASEATKVTNTGGPSGYVTQTLSITNRSNSVPLSISVFHMADFDVQPSVSNDSAKLIPGTKHIRITDPGGNYAGYEAPTADGYRVKPWDATGVNDVAGGLANTVVDDFTNSGLPFGPSDFTGGWQWSTVEIAPSDTRSFTVKMSVNNAAATTTTLSSDPNPSTVNGTVKLTANVATTNGGVPAAAGTVTFLDGAVELGSADVSGGTATLAASGLSAGSHTLTAVYNGTESLLASTSAGVSQVVETSADLSIAHTCTPDPVLAGGTISCHATLTNAGPGPAQAVAYSVTLPAGTTFTSLSASGGWNCSSPFPGDGGTVTCTRDLMAVGDVNEFTLDADIAADTAPGLLAVTATAGSVSLDGNTGNNTSESSVFVKGLTTTAVTTGGTPTLSGTAVKFTATVTGPGLPAGNVQFYDGPTPLGDPVALTAGAASLTTSSLSVGSHQITATYTGSTDYAGSTSDPITQVVTSPPPDPTPTPTPTPTPGTTGAGTGDAIGLGATPASAVLGDDGTLALDLLAKAGAKGTLTVTAAVPGARKKGSKKRKKAKVVTLVSTSFTVPASGKLPVRVKVRNTALKKLPKAIRTFKATLTIKVGTQTVKRTFTLKRPKPKKKPAAR